MPTIRFARLKFERKLSHYTDKRDAIERRKELLLNVIDFDVDLNSLLKQTDSHAKTRKGDWYFGDVSAEDNIISARLGKAKKKTDHLPDDEVEGFVELEREDAEIAFFVIDLESSVMAYEYVGNIGKKAPYRILRDTFNSYYQGEEEISISPLVDKQEVRKELEDLSYISEVTFRNLTPTNPDHTPTSKPMDDFLEDTRISRLHLRGVSDQRRNEPEGINLEDSVLLDGGLNLAEEGYGSATIEGKTREGDEKVVETGDIPIETEAELGPQDSVNRKRLIESIREALDELDE
ncbi:hypothetical protein [Halomicrobium salinisoli]|uniref:hypothetical protein n=1 Tax=Halomicrobium salinisoli TaxID=2878391 RepID=UPI001CF00506|nr:hypothetical protein [Halomicrobium salinisoli]